MMKTTLFSTKEMLAITGETKQRVQYWVLKGVFKPEDVGLGIGTTRRYSFTNLFEINLAQVLSRVLKNVDFIRSVMNEARKTCPQAFSPAAEHIPPNNNILSILIHSDNSIVIHVGGIDGAKKCLAKYVPKGFTSFHVDIAHIRSSLLKKVNIE